MSTPPTLGDLQKLGAKVEEAEAALDEARRTRDAAIRDVRRHTRFTVAEIAEAAGVSPGTVKAVTRGLR
jgi:DNA-binding transcriptional regulator YiaG